MYFRDAMNLRALPRVPQPVPDGEGALLKDKQLLLGHIHTLTAGKAPGKLLADHAEASGSRRMETLWGAP